MATLFDQQIDQTYQGLIKTIDNAELPFNGRIQLTDGLGNGSVIELGQQEASITNPTLYGGQTAFIASNNGQDSFQYGGNHDFAAAIVTGLPDTDTTYTISSAQDGLNADIKLVDQLGNTSKVTLVAGTNITLNNSGNDLTINAAGGGGFEPTVLSGIEQSLDLGQFNFFESQLTDNVTLSFTNVPAEKEWQYSFSGVAPYTVGELVYQQVKALGTDAQDMFFKPDGTQVFFITDGGTDTITARNLSVAWDISTISATVATFSFTAQTTTARGLTMSPDGTKMYITAESINTAFEYTLSTAFDITTATYSGNSITGLIGQAWSSFIKPDGTSFYVSGGGGTLQQWNLSTPFNLSTATLFGSYNTSIPSTQAITFNSTGTKAYTCSSESDTVYAYNLSTPWNITTATYNNESTFIGATESNPLDIFFKSNGTELYVVGNSNIREYESIGGPTVTFPASVQNPPTKAVLVDQSVTYAFYTLDGGTTVYLSGDSNQPGTAPGLVAGTGASSIRSAASLTPLNPASATASNTIALGNASAATSPNGIAIGNNALAGAGTNLTAIAIGTDVRITRDTGIAIGKSLQQSTSLNDFYRPVVIGFTSNVRGGDSIGIGTGIEITGTGTNNKIAIGNGASVQNVTGGVAIGQGVICSTANTVTIKRLQMLDYATLDFADDTAAAAGGIPLGGVYHTSGALKIRIV